MKKSKLEEEILKEIRTEKIRMKPKWWFSVISGGIRGIWLLLVLAVSISLSAIVYFLDIYKPTELAQYGDIGTELFFTDFPYLWLLGALVFFAGGAILMSRIGDNYKKTTRLVLALTTLVVIVATLAVLGVNTLLKFGI